MNPGPDRLQLLSTVTCPECRFQVTERMPLDRCVVVYQCPGCGRTLRPLPGDCCIFCSYGNVRCPPEQDHGAAERGDPPAQA